jgi:hypothetical protein
MPIDFVAADLWVPINEDLGAQFEVEGRHGGERKFRVK